MQIEQVRQSSEREQLAAMLAAAGLVSSDVHEAGVELWLLREDGQIVACGGLELHGQDALLRSLLVHEGWRGRGIAVMLLAALEAAARERGATSLWLLTTTAAAYFARHGYTNASRDTLPAALAASRQFAGLCPSSAVCMRKVAG